MIGTDIELAAQYLKEGSLVAIPTETVYGLAGNALSTSAVASIFKAKNRPAFDPLIVHVHSIDEVTRYVMHIPPLAEKLASAFWPGPLTLLLERKNIIPDLVTNGLPMVAIRVPKHPMALTLLSRLDFPLAAPSANPFGYISPTLPEHVEKHLGDKISYILDGGACRIGLESTIVGFPDGIPTVYRKGGLSLESLRSVVGDLVVKDHSSSNPNAPGMLEKHYSPTSPIVLGEVGTWLNSHPDKRIAVLSFRNKSSLQTNGLQLVLSPNGSDTEAAQHLFEYLRLLDDSKPDMIVAELLPEEGLGIAINDRLRRAAAR